MTKNFVEIIGFAGQDPKRSGNGNTSRVRLSVATNERWRDTDTGEKRERTEWHTVIFWNRLADIAADYVRKGSHILVSGAIKSRQYEDKGVSHTVWEVHARELLLLDPRTSTVDESDQAAPAPEAPPA
jgi:single-strand DNA-binding protein